MKKVCVFLAEGFEECEALIVVDILRRGGVEVSMVSVAGGEMVTGSHQISVKADLPIDRLHSADYDALFLPGGLPGTTNLFESETVRSIVSQYHTEGKILSAICAAPSIFGKMRLLQGKQATSYPSFEDALTGATVLQTEFVQDGNLLTGRGLGAAIPFGLRLLAMLQGEETAQTVRNAICYTH